jgi:hypothetical protein
MRHAQLVGRRPLKCGHLLAKDKLLRLKHMSDGFKQFLVKRLVLALEVQHGHGQIGVGWTLGRG